MTTHNHGQRGKTRMPLPCRCGAAPYARCVNLTRSRPGLVVYRQHPHPDRGSQRATGPSASTQQP
jgi:hypothetical protein